MKSRFLIFICFLIASGHGLLPASAESGADPLPVVPPMPGQVVRFDYLTDEDGLLSDETGSIFQDSEGFIWIANWNGIQRYDGYQFKDFHHDPDDPNTISHDFGAQFFEDSAGNFWISTVDGLNLYDRKTETFTRFYKDANNPERDNLNIFSISESSIGGLWLGTRLGLVHFYPKTNLFIEYRHNPEDPTSLSDDFVTGVLEDSRGDLWVSTFAAGLNKLITPLSAVQESIETQKEIPLQFDRVSLGDDKASNSMGHIIEDSASTLWFATRNGLARLIPSSEQDQLSFTFFRHDEGNPYSLSDNHVLTLLEDSAGVLWVGTLRGGLNQFDRESQKFRHYRNGGRLDSVRTDQVMDIHEDTQGLLWISSGVNGVSILDRRPLAFGYYRQDVNDPNSLSHSGVTAFWEGTEGDLWIGTSGGLNHLVMDDYPHFVHFLHDEDDPASISSDRISEVLKDSSGSLWVGTYDAGLNRLRPGEARFERFRNDEKGPVSLSNDRVYSLAEDLSGNIWVGTGRGLDRFTDVDGPAFDRVYETDKRISVIYTDSQGNVWFGNEEGLKKLPESDLRSDNPQVLEYPYMEGGAEEHSNDVQTIAEDAQGYLWIGSFDGLQKFDPKMEEFVNRYYANDPAPGSVGSHGLVFDAQGNLWAGGGTIYKFNPLSEIFTEYTESDGVMSGLVNHAYGGPGGRIYFGGYDGLNAFYPQNITPHDYTPPTVLTDFLLYNETVAVSEEGVLQQQINASNQIVLDHDNDIFAFDFSALNYRNPQQNQYAYYLEGFDKDWIYTDANNRRATYTNIAPGDYTFHVKGSNDAGVWNENPASVNITILPPWWGTWWFRAGTLLFVTGLIYGGYRWRRRNLENRNKELEHEVAVRTNELEQAHATLELRVDQRTAELSDTVGRLQEAKTESQQHLEVEQKLAAISSQFMHSSEFAIRLDNVLAETADLIGSDRVFLLQFMNSGVTMMCVAEWTASDTSPLFPQGKIVESEPWLVQVLRDEGDYFVDDVAHLEQETGSLALLKGGISGSRCALPVYAGEEMLGIFGCHGRADSQSGFKQYKQGLDIIVGMLGNAWQRERTLDSLEQRIADRTRDLAAFFDLAMLASETRDLEDVLQPALSRIMAASNSRALCIHLMSEQGSAMQLVAQQGLTSEEIEAAKWMAPGDEFDFWMQSQGDPIITQDLPNAELVPEPLKLASLQTYLGAHIRTHGISHGLLSCYRRNAGGFALDEISLLVALAEQLGVVVENHRLRHLMEDMAILTERQRLARDLHDSITQSLYSQTLFARSGRDAIEDGDFSKLDDSMEMLEETAHQALREMRLLLYQLQPAALERVGLAAAINERLAMVERRLGIQATSMIPNDLSLSDDVEEGIFRVIMEALNNSLKHAEANQIDIELALRERELVLSITDDGCGFDTGNYQAGMGIQIMRDRVDQLSGEFSLNSELDRGTSIIVILDHTGV